MVENEFFNWANTVSLGGAIIFIAIIIGILAILIRSVNKVAKIHKEYILTEHEKIETKKKLQEDVDKLRSNVDDIKELISSSTENNSNRITSVEKGLDQYKRDTIKISKSITKIDKTVSILIESDKEDIKSYIVSQYHKWMELGYIDIYAYETILLRYENYKKEHGNSFVKKLIDELEQLEKRHYIEPKDEKQ